MKNSLPVLYGITHDARSEEVIARVPRAVKVAIGKPKGPALHTLLVVGKDGKTLAWQLEIGVPSKTVQVDKEWYQLDERPKLERRINELRDKVPPRKYPEKLPYFTFFRDRGDGQLVHDLDAIFLHGPKPTSIDIMFTDNSPFAAEYQWWGTKGKVCSGNGLLATRLNGDAKSQEHKRLAEESAAAGLSHYIVEDGCYLGGCPYAGKECKPHGYLSFQLLQDLRIGSKAEVATTSRASINQFFASLNELMVFIGAGDPERANLRGLPLTLTMRPFRTNHNNIPGVAYKMAVEFRAGNRETMKAKLIEAAETFGMVKRAEQPAVTAGALKQIAAPVEEMEILESAQDESEVDEGIVAAQNNAFFESGEAEDGEGADPEAEESAKETVAEAAAALMSETEMALRANAAAKKEEQEPVKADDLGAHRYESNQAAAANVAKIKFGGKK